MCVLQCGWLFLLSYPLSPAVLAFPMPKLLLPIHWLYFSVLEFLLTNIYLFISSHFLKLLVFFGGVTSITLSSDLACNSHNLGDPSLCVCLPHWLLVLCTDAPYFALMHARGWAWLKRHHMILTAPRNDFIFPLVTESELLSSTPSCIYVNQVWTLSCVHFRLVDPQN